MAGVGVRVGRCRGRRCRGAESPVLRPHTSVATLHASAATPLRPTGDGSCQIPSLKVQSEPTQLGFQRGILTSQHRRWLNRLIHRVDSPGACDPTRPWQRAPLLGGGTPTDLGSGPLRPTGGEPCQIPSPKVQSEPTELGFQRGDLTPITGRAPESQNRPAPRGGRAGFRMWKGPPSQLWEESAGRPNQYSLDYVGVTREPQTSRRIVPRKLVAH